MTGKKGKSKKKNGDERRDSESSTDSGESTTAQPTVAEWIEIDKLYQTPNIHIREYSSSEKLRGHSNFKSWKDLIKLELRAFNLLQFIESECGMSIKVSPMRRVMLDAQTVQLIHASVSESIKKRVNQIYNAFATFKELVRLFGENRCQDLGT